MYWRIAQGFALVVLLFWAGAFSLYVFPGRSEEAQIVAPVPTPYVSVCEQLRQRAMTQGSLPSDDMYQRLIMFGCVGRGQTCDCGN
jgi:hypothetical protein